MKSGAVSSRAVFLLTLTLLLPASFPAYATGGNPTTFILVNLLIFGGPVVGLIIALPILARWGRDLNRMKNQMPETSGSRLQKLLHLLPLIAGIGLILFAILVLASLVWSNFSD